MECSKGAFSIYGQIDAGGSGLGKPFFQVAANRLRDASIAFSSRTFC